MPPSQQRRLLFSLIITGTLLSCMPGGSILHSQSSVAGAHRAAGVLVLHAGEWHSDLDGVVGAARVELALGGGGRWLFVPGLTYAHYTLRSPTQIDMFVPEALIHFQLSRGRVRPYVGGGAGLSLVNVIRTFDPVLTLGAGLRLDVTPEWGARLEGDLRSFGFEVGTVGWSIGIARRF